MSIITIILFLIFAIFIIWLFHFHTGYKIAKDYFNKSEITELINNINNQNLTYQQKLELFGKNVFEPLILVVTKYYVNYTFFWYRYSAVSLPIIIIGTKQCKQFK